MIFLYIDVCYIHAGQCASHLSTKILMLYAVHQPDESSIPNALLDSKGEANAKYQSVEVRSKNDFRHHIS
jgi:hypothetical protein